MENINYKKKLEEKLKKREENIEKNPDLKLIDTLQKEGHDYITRPSMSSKLYRNSGWSGITEYLDISLIEKRNWYHKLSEAKMPAWKQLGYEYRKEGSINECLDVAIGAFSECTFASIGYIIEGSETKVLVVTKPEILLPAVEKAFGKLQEYKMPKDRNGKSILFEELEKIKTDKPFIVVR